MLFNLFMQHEHSTWTMEPFLYNLCEEIENVDMAIILYFLFIGIGLPLLICLSLVNGFFVIREFNVTFCACRLKTS